MTYLIRHRHKGVDVIDPDDNSATYIRYQDIPDFIDKLQEAYAARRNSEGVTGADIPDSVIDHLLR